ncbi:MAG: hypothetical protein WD768_13220 [Phycisphaeraceae bacterium]
MSKDQTNYQKLKRARRERDVYTESLTVRVEYDVMRAIKQMSSATGRTVADLFRAGLEIVIAAGRRVSTWKRELKDESDDPGPAWWRFLTSDNIRYVQLSKVGVFKPLKPDGEAAEPSGPSVCQESSLQRDTPTARGASPLGLDGRQATGGTGPNNQT